MYLSQLKLEILLFVGTILGGADKLIKHNAVKIEKYNNPGQLKDWVIGEPLWPKLNKLKKSNPEAFFYWYKIYELSKK